MSLAPTAESGGFQRPSGKTPPPAPSAAFAKRAREMQEDTLGRYRPPALRGLSQGSSRGGAVGDTIAPPPAIDDLAPSTALPPPSIPPGFRRARAGTLPSNVQLAAQQYADSPIQESAPELPPIRPGLRHAASVASSVASQNVTSRLRSGSLTLPSAGLSNPFGSSIFSSSWLSNTNGYPVLDELRSITSGDSEIDHYDVHTLDYLGLDDAPFRTPPPATVSELRAQAQSAIAQSLAAPSRMRASTVSNPYRRRNGTLLNTPSVEIQEADMEDQQGEDDYPSGPMSAAPYIRTTENTLSPATALYPSNNAPYVAKGFKPLQHLSGPAPVRPRAISVGNLDDSNRLASVRRATVTEGPPGLVRKPSYNELNSSSPQSAGIIPTSGLPSPAVNSSISSSILRNVVTANGLAAASLLNKHVPSTATNTVPRISTSHLGTPQPPTGRSVSPSRENAQGQIPSRSLWIGNLDPTVTGEDLAHVFATYGAIESFRLLPEKECGFVNFVDMQDAIRAKDDVLNRLGGNIGQANGQAVRIGFGKADSAPPLTPVNGGLGTPTPVSAPGVNTLLSPGNPAGAGPNSPGGIESQLQSSPTRALWIGSIPATTTPATILSIFSPFGPIESARVLTHKNCGFINFERLDDAVRARKALNGRDVLGSDVGAIRIGYARVPVKNGADAQSFADENASLGIPGAPELTVGDAIQALQGVKGASTIPVDQQIVGGAVENYRSNLLLSLIASGMHEDVAHLEEGGSITEQQMIMRALSGGSPDAEPDIIALADFRPPSMYYSSIPTVSERVQNRRWDASRLRELRKRMDSGACSNDEIDMIASNFMDGEIVELASDWLGNTVVQKLFEKCSDGSRYAMLDKLAPHLATVGIHKNGTWAAQKIIECARTEEEMILVAQHLRPYTPPLLLDQFGNYVVQCCLRFGSPMNDFIIDAMVDRLWEVAQGRFGARSMRAVLENPNVTISQQRRLATAVILNSIPLATNPNGALLLTWLLDTSGFASRYRLLAPRFTPHLSHLCTHKLASSTVLRIVNQNLEPEASTQIVNALFHSPGDHVLTDVLGDQVNGVALVLKVLQSPFVEPNQKAMFVDATKRVLIELKVSGSQAYRRLCEEVGLPVSGGHLPTNTYGGHVGVGGGMQGVGKKNLGNPGGIGIGGAGGLPPPNSAAAGAYQEPSSLAAMMAALQLQAVGLPLSVQPQLQINSSYGGVLNGMSASQNPGPTSSIGTGPAFSPSNDPFNPFAREAPSASGASRTIRRGGAGRTSPNPPMNLSANNTTNPAVGANVSHIGMYGNGSASANMSGMGMMGSGGANANNGGLGGAGISPAQHQQYQQYMYQLYQQQQQQNAAAGTFHA
ncbi:hypothetical protein FRC03_010235 [Tulasnella sp. 419]|nr:hypothetical protein FRC03_010235 [Tulasnella sp. 419]